MNSFDILVIEQEEGKLFNRGKLLNIGAKFAFDAGATHIVTHDVDMIPIKADYSIGECVHLATKCEQFEYRMPYARYFGGVTMFSKEAFIKANGYSNNYWGWGAEDDDMLLRCEKAGIAVERRLCRYKSLAHRHALNDPANRIGHQINSKRCLEGYDYTLDGFNTLEYKLLSDTSYIKVSI
jgi:hypothetical protein